MKIIVEVPHQLPVEAWLAESDRDIIEYAHRTTSYVYVIDNDTVEYKISDSDTIETVPTVEAPTEMDVALDAIRCNLHKLLVLSVHEAQTIENTYQGHQELLVQRAVRDVLEREGLI